MAIDVFLKLDGIKGESTQKGHEGEIELLSANVGVSDRAPVPTGAVAAAGKVSFQDLHVTKTTDSASPQLFVACSSGKHIATGTLTAVPTGGNGPHLTIDLTDVLVSSYDVNITQQTPSETITFAYGSLKVSYQAQDSKGVLSPPVQGGWDVTKNKAV